jgi:hypothetical protein
MSIGSAGLSAGLLVLSLSALGCGKSGTVSGKVSYHGETLGSGTVLFFAPGQKSVKSEIAPDGTYTIAGIPTGTVKIAVETKTAQPPDEDAIRKAFPSLPKNAPLPPEAANSPLFKGSSGKGGKYVWIPDIYSDPDKSNLKLEVTGGDQHHDIDLP